MAALFMLPLQYASANLYNDILPKKKVEKVVNKREARKFASTVKTSTVQNRVNYAPLAIATGSKTLTAYRIYDDVDQDYTFVNIDTDAPATVTPVGSPRSTIVYAGFFYDGDIYGYVSNAETQASISWSKFDATTGDETVIADYSARTEFFSDATYDYTTNMGYYILFDSESTSEFGTVTLAGVVTPIASGINGLFTLAADSNGQLWGVGVDGNLYQVNKTDGTLTLVGATGITPAYIQSMDFDRDDNTLYWAMTNSSDAGELCTINTTTGAATSLGVVGGNAELTCLHVPFTAAPAAAPAACTDLVLTPGAAGDLTATVTATAPTLNVDGSALTEITKVEIFLNNVLEETITPVASGDALSHSLVLTTSGIYTVKLVATNSAGTGLATSVSAFIGEDAPGAPENVVLTTNDDNYAILNWDAPTSGKCGGYFDAATVVYDVLRLNDSVMVAMNLTTTTFTDNTITALGNYIYSVRTRSASKLGEEEYSNTLVIGDALDVPVVLDPATENDFAIWTVIDADADGTSWYFAGENTVGGAAGADGANDWLISPKLNLEAGKNYKLSFLYQAQAMLAAPNESFAIYLGTANDAAAMTTQITSITDTTGSVELVELSFTVPANGEYFLGWHLTSPASQDWVSGVAMTQIAVDEYLDTDLHAVAFTSGVMTPLANAPLEFGVEVRNEGFATINSYSVELIDNAGTVLDTEDVTAPIASLQTARVTLNWTPTVVAETQLFARVVCAGDANVANDTTDVFVVDVQGDNDATFRAGHQQLTFNGCPLNYYYNSSYAQMLYVAEETGFTTTGEITEITFFLDAAAVAASKDNVEIYIQQTDLTVLDAWVPTRGLVYSGTLTADVVTNGQELTITLDEPYVHNGGNILVTVNSPMYDDFVYVDGVNFLLTLTSEETVMRSAIFYSDDEDFTNTAEVNQLNAYPNIKFAVTNLGVPPVATNNVEMEFVQLYPNPVKNILNVEGQYDYMEVYNAAGAKVINVSTYQNTVDMSELANGVYLIKVYRGEEVELHRIIK